MLTPTMRFLAFTSRFIARPAETVSVPHARAGMVKATRGPPFLFGRPPPLEAVVDEAVASIPTRRYRPATRRPGTLVYFHGGGWVTGDLDSHDTLCRFLAADLSREVVAVHYRRAPEAPAPAAADDCEAVTRALLQAGGPVAVAGDSAGGNLAAVVANRCAATGTRLAAQVLVYPVTDCAAETASYARFAEGFLLSRTTMRYFRDSYAPTDALRLHPDVSPLRAPSLRGAPPAYVLLAGCDVLRDEGRAYATRLREAGVDTELAEVPGVLHGFFSMQGLGVTREATGRLGAWLGARLDAG